VRPFLAVWLVAWLAVGVGALRSVSALARMTYAEPQPDREAVAASAARARRWAYAMAGMGVVMALVSPWL